MDREEMRTRVEAYSLLLPDERVVIKEHLQALLDREEELTLEVNVQVNKEELVCPFCNEDNFDLIGLKNHYLKHCEEFNNTENIR